MKKYILASGSPRRKELLGYLDIDFDVVVSDCDEDTDAETPEDLVMALSERKCRAVSKLLAGNTYALQTENAALRENVSQNGSADQADVPPAKNEHDTEKCITGTGDSHIIIGADTIVVLDGNVLGKPKDEGDAFNTLRALSGNTHTVNTGVTLLNSATGQKSSFFEATDVTMYELTDKEILDYIATGDPMDKAGSYGIQSRGALLVKKINGDYFNVVGLPVAKLYRGLKNFVKNPTIDP